MEALWQEQPRILMQLVHEMKEKQGWSKRGVTTIDTPVAGTAETAYIPDENDAGEEAADDRFRYLTVKDEEIITADFAADLTGGKVTFLTIEVSEDMEAVMHYTYGTEEKNGAKWGSENGEENVFDLIAAPDEDYGVSWTDEKVTLKKGMNIFYISGSDMNFKMHFEVQGLDKSKVTYVGAYTREEALEKLKIRLN